MPFTAVRLSGELGTRYTAATCNLLTRTDRYPISSFAASAAGKPGALWWDWPGDQIGRWLSVLSVAEGYGWSEAAWHRKAVGDTVLSLQTKEGNFGPPGSANSDDARIPSGNGFALRGLMDAYTDTKDPRYLEAARKLARYFESIAPKWEARSDGKLHEFYGHCLDGLVALSEQGGDKWALELAERLAQRAGRTKHTHHSLSLCRGLIDLARVTGKKEYLAKVEDYLSWCRECQTVDGGLPEEMPQSPQDEGCALADWIVVNLMMYQVTGEERYLDDAEHTLVNHFFANQFHTGGFGHRSFSQEIVGGKNWQGWDGQFGSENPGCCSLWGQWALGQVGRFILTQADRELRVNLYPSAEITLAELGARLEITSDFPRMTKARIRVACEKPQLFSLSLRVPTWAGSMKVMCDGRSVTGAAQPGGDQSAPGLARPNPQMTDEGLTRRLTLSREWAASTVVDVEFGTNGYRVVPWPAKKPIGNAVFKGPLCLSLSSDDADIDASRTYYSDGSERPFLDILGQVMVDGRHGMRATLSPVGAGWLTTDVKNPARKRILFQVKKGE